MSFLQKKPKRNRPGFEAQFDIANIRSGVMTVMNDDGCGKSGEANQQRQVLFRKLDQRDEDGDPLFCLATPPGEYPEPIMRGDFPEKFNPKATPNKSRKVSAAIMHLDDPSRSPEFKTLRDKYNARDKARREFIAEQGENRAIEKLAQLDAAQRAVESAAAKRANADAAKSVKPKPARAKKDAES